jgi:hypothetical protein
MPDRRKTRYALADAVAHAESEDSALLTVARRLFPELGADCTSVEMQQLITSHCAKRHKLRAEQVRSMPKAALMNLLTADIETASGKTAAATVPLTGLMTNADIAEMFGVSNQKVAEILSKHEHFKVGRKYRMRIEDMPPKYKKRFGSN